MPKFTIEHETSKAPDAAYTAVKSFVAQGGEIKKFDANAQFTFDDSKKSCNIKGSQFKAEMNVAAAGPGSKILVTVDLPLLLTPFKGKVQEALTKMLKKHLA